MNGAAREIAFPIIGSPSHGRAERIASAIPAPTATANANRPDVAAQENPLPTAAATGPLPCHASQRQHRGRRRAATRRSRPVLTFAVRASDNSGHIVAQCEIDRRSWTENRSS